METNTTRFASIVLLVSVIAAFVSASADPSYGKTQLEGYMPPKPATPKDEHPAYGKTTPKVPTKPVNPKEEHESYEKPDTRLPTKPVVPKKDHDIYEKPDPKLPTKPVVPKKEHEVYDKPDPKLPTKPLDPKGEYGAYKKPDPKLPTKPVDPKGEYGMYKKTDPKLPTKPMVPKKEYGTYGKPDPKLPTKPMIPKEEHEGYGKVSPKVPTPEKPLLPKVPDHPKNIAVQGLIYCKYGSKLLPLQGAIARVSCLAVHKNGYKSTPFSFLSRPADEKGYFLAKMSSSKLLKDDMWEIIECKAFLEKSPWTSCKNPEDTNGGISGAHLTFSRHLSHNGFCLSSAGPFIYNPGHESLPKEGY